MFKQKGFTPTPVLASRPGVFLTKAMKQFSRYFKLNQLISDGRTNTTPKLVSGFTLIELLVVIAIIGILSSVVMVGLNSSRAKARDSRRITDIKQIQLALELYGSANGGYPDDIYATGGAGLAPNYMSVVPKDPVGSSTNYQYGNVSWDGSAVSGCGSPSICNYYWLAATLEQNNSALSSDRDLMNTSININGTDPVFDVTP